MDRVYRFRTPSPTLGAVFLVIGVLAIPAVVPVNAIGPVYLVAIWLAVPAVPLGIVVWTLQAARKVTVGQDGQVHVMRTLGRLTVRAEQIRAIRPLLSISRVAFALEHSSGTQWLAGDGTTIALLAKDLRSLNPALITRGVPPLPGEPGTDDA